MSLVVDTPKQGSGTSNTGNTARRAFEAAEEFSEITGVNKEVITRLRTILKAVCSGYHLDLDKFKTFCHETSELIVDLYPWYVMPPSLHKLLEHGFQVAEQLDLPIGAYSEEAQKTSNNAVRNARLSHTSRISRKNTMENQFHYLLLRTDPVVSSYSFKKFKTFGGSPLEPDVLNLLMDEI